MRMNRLGMALALAAGIGASPLAAQEPTAVASPRTFPFTLRYERHLPVEGVLTIYPDSSVVTTKTGACYMEPGVGQTRSRNVFRCDQVFNVDYITIVVDRTQPSQSKWYGEVQTPFEQTTDTCAQPKVDKTGARVGCTRYATRTAYRSSRAGGFLELAAAK